MPTLHAVESTLTDRYQTTVPESVRRALKLGKRDKIQYEIRASGEVVLTRVTKAEEGDDPVLGAFLAFLARDIAQQPDRLKPLDQAFVQRLQSLTGAMKSTSMRRWLRQMNDRRARGAGGRPRLDALRASAVSRPA